MTNIVVIDPDGKRQQLAAPEGWRVMEILREHGLPVGGLCGGACACATCHVEVEDDWIDRIHPARDEEEAMLDTVPVLADGSRLSCQIIFTAELDGLTVRLPDAA